MKKKILSLVLIGGMVISLAACGKADTSVETTTETSSVETTTAETTTAETTTAETTAEETTASGEKQTADLEGSVADILAAVYANADLSSDLREAMEYYQTTEIAPETAEYILGTAEVAYTDSVYSAPMMSSVAYQCVIVRVEDGTDVEAAKQTLYDSADPRKWVCVEPESIVAESVDNLILVIMADSATTQAVADAFLALAE